jgi:AGCS family alanine or glycine:cation symporter
MILIQLPVIATDFKSAFNMEAGFGAVFGLEFNGGVKRGIYSNEAGPYSYILQQLQMLPSLKQGLVFQVYNRYVVGLLSNRVYVTSTEGQYNVQIKYQDRWSIQ